MMSASNSDDPPPYLPAGTEVSAKFKGAFCEAKIKKLDKQVKCKITLKSNNEQITVNDNVLRASTGQLLTSNDFKMGSVVYVSKTNPNNDLKAEQVSPDVLQAAILNKVTDYSHYTVIFNDGDEKANMKRSLIRFKGEKHYLDSETLNNAPLNNPEHFLYPIKNQTKQSPSSGDNKQNLSDNESDMTSNAGGDEDLAKKKGKMIDESKVEEDDDGDDSDCDSTSSSDDYPAEEKDRFVAQLFKFMDDRGTPMNKVPSINKIDLDLHKFFIVVRKFGGYNKVVKQRCWGDIYKRLGLPNPNVSNIINLKSAYERYLQAYEDFFRKLGSSMCDLVSLRHSSSATGSKRSSVSESHRSLYKNRYQTPATTSSQKTKTVVNKTKKQTPNPNSSTANEAPSSPASSTQKSMLDTHKLKRLSIDDITDENNMSDTSHNKEITIESLVNHNLMASNSSIDEQQQPEELTLFSMLEDSKKAKRLEEEKKKKEKLKLEEQQQPDYSSDSEKKDAKASKEDTSKSATPNQAQKRPLSVHSAKQKGTRSSTEKLKIKTEAKEDEQEDDGEPKAKKKASRLSTSDDVTTLKSTGLKRKSSISKALTDANDESENEKDTSSQDGTNESNMDVDVSENSSRNFTINDLEVHTALDVKYGNTNQQYRAKVLSINHDNQTVMVHYLGWNTRYDEYIKLDKIVKIIRPHVEWRKQQKAKNKSNISTSSENQAASSPSANSKTNNQSKSVTTQKISKRSSSSTASSSYSSTEQPLEATKANNAESSTKTTSKTRNSDSVSSNSSTNSLKRESSEDLDKKSSLASSTSSASSVLPLITPTSIPNTIETRVFEVKQEKEPKAKEEKSKASVDTNEKKTEKSAELSNSLLSIKEEIMNEIKSEPSANILESLQTDKVGNDVEKVASRRSSMNTKDNELNSPKLLTPKADAPIAELHKLNSPKERSSPRANLNEDKAESVKKSPSCSSVNTQSSKTANSKNESKSAHKDKQKESEALVIEPIGTKALENVNESKTNAALNECSSSNAKSTINHNSNDKSKQVEVNNSVDSTINHVAETNKEAEISKKNTTITSPVVEEARKGESVIENLSSKSSDLNLKLSNPAKSASNSSLAPVSEDSVLNSITNSKKTDLVINNSVADSKHSFHIISVNLFGKQKIKYIEDQMRLCREAYAKLKNEIASIDRKKKKLKRNHMEKSNLANTGDEC